MNLLPKNAEEWKAFSEALTNIVQKLGPSLVFLAVIVWWVYDSRLLHQQQLDTLAARHNSRLDDYRSDAQESRELFREERAYVREEREEYRENFTIMMKVLEENARRQGDFNQVLEKIVLHQKSEAARNDEFINSITEITALLKESLK